MDITQLIDNRYELTQQKEALERQIAELDHEIACKLLEAGEKQAYGTNGIGYALHSTTKYDYGKAAYRYLEDKGLLDQFMSDPKITKTKLQALLKEGAIDYNDMAEIQKWTTVEQSPYGLRKVVNKEAVVA